MHKYFRSDKQESFKILDKEKNTLADIQGEGKQVVGGNCIHPNGNKYEVVDNSEIGFISYAELKALFSPYLEKEEVKIKEERNYEKNDLSEKYKIKKTFFNQILNSAIADIKIKNSIKKKENIKVEKQNLTDDEIEKEISELIESKDNLKIERRLKHLCDNSDFSIGTLKEKFKQDKKRVEDVRYVIFKNAVEGGGGCAKLINSLKDIHGNYPEKLTAEVIKNLSIIPVFVKSPEIYLKWAVEKNKEIEKELKAEDKKQKNEKRNNNDSGAKQRYNIMTRRGQIEEFWEKQPFYYDDSRIFWLWDKENYQWVKSDEVDFCLGIYKVLGVDTIDKKTKGEIIEGFKQIGRFHKPKEIGKSWIQFKNKIYDVRTDESFEATPEYFITNPIPFKVGESEDTPTIDKYFSEWVNEEYIETLYQIIAYTLSLDKFMQRIIALVGGGSNGKGTYAKLIKRFIGKNNCVASEIKALSEDRFEASNLYRKLFCEMGEVSYDDLKNTNMLKKIAGEDMLSFQFKGKDSFSDDNTATCICLTNSLPTTPDKTMGFYRKWLIVDFPNQFKQIKENIINKIPEVEFENLAKKSLRFLKELYENTEFKNEGDFEEREKRYEERSNPVIRFVENFCDEEEGNMISLREFTNACNEYLKSNHLRVLNSKQIGRVLRDEGFVVGTRKINNVSACVIVNLKVKTINTTNTIQNQIRISPNRASTNLDGNDGNDGFFKNFTQEDIKKSGLDPKLIKKTIKEINKK